MISPTIFAIVLAIFAGLAFTGGFVVSDWRSASHIQQLGSENAMLSAANDKCTVDIRSVRKAMGELAASSTKREKNAAKAIRRAEADATRHTNAAKKTSALPSIKPERQYEVITKEQIEYVQKRHESQ